MKMNLIKNITSFLSHKNIVALEGSFVPGGKFFFPSDSKTEDISVVFEDDGTTGYFYAVSRKNGKQTVLNALNIYNVKELKEKKKSKIKVSWSKDGKKALLIINQYPKAVLNFETEKGYIKGSVIPSTGNWENITWDDSVMEWFTVEPARQD